MAERGGVSSKVSPARQQGKLWESCKAPPAPPFDPHSHSNIGREGLAVPTYRGRSENSRSPGQGCLEGQREPVSPPLLISPLSPAVLSLGGGGQWSIFPHPQGSQLAAPHISGCADFHSVVAGDATSPGRKQTSGETTSSTSLFAFGTYWNVLASSYLYVFS